MGNGATISSDVPGQGYFPKWSHAQGLLQIIPTTWGTVEPGPTQEEAAARILREHRRRWTP